MLLIEFEIEFFFMSIYLVFKFLFFFLVGLKFIMVSIFFIFYNMLLIKCIKVDNIICNFRSKLKSIINKYMDIFVSEFV